MEFAQNTTLQTNKTLFRYSYDNCEETIHEEELNNLLNKKQAAGRYYCL